MSISNRYYLVRNRHNPCLITGNIPWLGGDGDYARDTYLNIPFLDVLKYPNSGTQYPDLRGICYYMKHAGKTCIILSIDITQAMPGAITSFVNYRNRPLYIWGANSSCVYFGKGKKTKDDPVADQWIVNDDYCDAPALSCFNLCYASTSDWDGYNINGSDWYTNAKIAGEYLDVGGNPALGNTYQCRPAYYAHDAAAGGGDRYEGFAFVNNKGFYYRAEDAIDVTPVDSRAVEDVFAGKWTNGMNQVLYLGMPVFEFSADGRAYRMIPVETATAGIQINTPSPVDPAKNDVISGMEYSLMEGYDNSLKYSYYNLTHGVYNGTGWDYAYEKFIAFGYDEKEKNGGYYRLDVTDSYASYVADEEKKPPVLHWCVVGEESGGVHGDLSGSYLGSTLEKNILHRYVKFNRSSYLNFAFRSLNQNYWYDEAGGEQ